MITTVVRRLPAILLVLALHPYLIFSTKSTTFILAATVLLTLAVYLFLRAASRSGLTLLADRVRLDLEGPPHALVDVTPAAVAELSLSSGSEVWLTTKATDLEVYPRADRQEG